MVKHGNAKGTPVPKPFGKGVAQVLFPSRAALNEVTKGNPVQQSMGNYAKLVPSGANVPTYQDIIHMGSQPKVEPGMG